MLWLLIGIGVLFVLLVADLLILGYIIDHPSKKEK